MASAEIRVGIDKPEIRDYIERRLQPLLDERDDLAARLARVEALADKWRAEVTAPFGEAHMSYAYAAHTLSAALAPAPTPAEVEA
jgi:hypothetical protein